MLKKIIKDIKKSRRSRLIVLIAIIAIVLPFAVNTLLNTIANQAKADSFFKFDEGYGTTSSVNDSNGAVSAGSITGAVWKNEDFCFDGKCLYFDGNQDFVSFADDADLDFAAADSFTIGFWFRHGAMTSGTQVMIDKLENTGTDGGYKIQMESDGDITCAIEDDDADTTIDDSITSTAATYDDSNWHYATCVKSATSSLTLYIDAQQVAQDTSLDASSSLANDDTFYIGIDGDGTSNDYMGFIDEVKVYRSAKTAAEIKGDYAKGSTLGEVSASFLGNKAYLTEGLVGYWTFNEARTSPGTATDYSGNGITLTDPGIARVSGRFKNAIDLESGSSQYFYAADNAHLSITGSLTISAWIKPESVTAATLFNIASKFNGADESYQLSLYGDEVRLYVGSSSNYATTQSANITTTAYTHILATYNASTQSIVIYVNGVASPTTVTGTIPSSISDNSVDFQVGTEDSASGTGGANFYDGIIDELRVYNKAFSAADVYNMYNWKPAPLHHWKFDENTGTSSTYDTSGNSNTGTLRGGMNTASWVPGKFGSALYFDGSNDYVSTATQTILNEALEYYTISLWFKTNTTTGGKLLGLGTAATGASSSYDSQLYMRNDGLLQFNWWDSVTHTITSTSTYNDNNWHFVAVTYQLSGITMYVDGVQVAINTDDTSGRSQFASYWRIAYDTLSGEPDEPTSYYYKGALDDIRIYTYVRTPQEIIEDMNGGHSAPGSPVGSALGYWKMDEGYGDIANNSGSGGSTYNGNLAGSGTTCPTTGACPTWSNTSKYGKALSFDGIDDYVDLGTSLDDNDEITVSAWVNADTLSSGGAGILGNYLSNCASGDYQMYLNSSTGKFIINWNNTDVIVSRQTISTGSWYHLAFTRSGSLGNWTVKTYINGNLDNTANTSFNPNGTNVTTAIGRWGACSVTGFFDGFIDDARIYNNALTDDQIKLIYNQGEAAMMGTLGNNSTYEKQSAAQEYCIPGDTASCSPPVAHWKFDDNTGLTVNDISGNNNTGTWTGTLGTQWTTGKIASAGNFIDSNSNVINAGTGSSLQLQTQTMSAWIYLDSGVAASSPIIFSRSDDITAGGYEWAIRTATSTPYLGFAYYDGSVRGWYLDTVQLSRDTWIHVAGVWNSTAGTVTFYINGVPSTPVSTTTGTITHIAGDTARIGYQPANNYWRGKIDDLKIYNYARTANQIKWDMNRGEPLAWYKFDECTGTTANNAAPTTSGADAGYDATISIGGTGDYSAPGTCNGSATDSWKAGATGKFEGSIAFDGSDDYAYLASDLSVQGWTALTVSAWIYPISGGNGIDHVIIGKSDANNAGYGNTSFRIMYDYANKLSFRVQPDGDFNSHEIVYSNALLMNSRWYHVVGTWDGSNMHLYVDGVLVGSDTTAGNAYLNNCQALYMGRHSANNIDTFYNGLLDDVRIYNYALTSDQIKTVHNNGAVRFR